MLTVEQIMSREVVTVSPDTSVRRTIETLLGRHISGLPVVESDGRLVGIVSEFALLAVVYDSEIMEQPIRTLMTTQVIAVQMGEPITRAADLCILHRLRRLPVMKEGRLAGMLTRRDVLRALYSTQPRGAAAPLE